MGVVLCFRKQGYTLFYRKKERIMKKAFSLLLALVMCLSLCACGGEKETVKTTVPPESIFVSNLFEDIDNGAKCKLNVGKQVTILGQIEGITADFCIIHPVSQPDKDIAILMPTERLAELSVGHFIAVTGIVKSYNGKYNLKYYSSWYTISATELLDENVMDDIFRRIVAIDFTYDLCNKAYFFRDSLHILYDYMSQRSSVYTMESNEELREYLCGKWDCGYFVLYFPDNLSRSKFESFEITFNKDGSAKYAKQNSWRHDWEVGDDGRLASFFGKKCVFILSKNVFICDGYVFVRQE
jgi:hypothetical protein